MRKSKPLKRVSERTSVGTSARGGTLYGIGVGILMGLVVAAAVAFYITRAPVPFLDRTVKRFTSSSLHANRRQSHDFNQALDPNQGLYDLGASRMAPRGAVSNAMQTSPPNRDDLGALIASLPKHSVDAATPTRVKIVDKSSVKANAHTARKADTPGKYFLQVGTYRGTQDAEALRARILLLGLPVIVSRTVSHGKFFNRVCVGPFARVDAMNRARRQLWASRIKVVAVRQ